MNRFLTALAACLLVCSSAFGVELNSRGQVAAGVGGTAASFDGKVLATPAGGTKLVTDDVVVYQVCRNEACVVETYDQRTGLKAVALSHGANFIEANGGVWAAWFGSLDPNTAGITTSTGLRFATSGLGPVGPDGALAIKNDYQSAGPWDVIEKDGRRWRLSDGDAFAINLLGNGRAMWIQPGVGFVTRGIPKPQVFSSPAWWFKAVQLNNEWWILYQREEGALVLHPFNSPVGYVLAPAGSSTYRPAVVQLASGVVRVAWATVESELPGQIAVRDVNLAVARVDTRPVVITPPPPPPVDPPHPVPETLIAPNRIAVVAQVITDHPEINACDEVARGTIVDYAAQRLNAAEGKVIWGRKSRNKEGTDLNTDGLTFKRPDGKFEIYDSVGGGSCKATWDGFGPFAPGQNGFWVAPVLAPEGGVTAPPPPPTEDPRIARLTARVAQLEQMVAEERASNSTANLRISQLEAERDDLKSQLETLRSAPASTCSARVETGWARALGARASCSINK